MDYVYAYRGNIVPNQDPSNDNWVRRLREGCSVYVISSIYGGKSLVKVGISADPDRRISAIQTSCPFQLLMPCQVWHPCRKYAAFVEKNFHKCFHNDRLNGEWFNLSAKDAMFGVCLFSRTILRHACRGNANLYKERFAKSNIPILDKLYKLGLENCA